MVVQALLAGENRNMNRRRQIKQIRLNSFRAKQRYKRIWQEFDAAICPVIESLRNEVLDVLRGKYG